MNKMMDTAAAAWVNGAVLEQLGFSPAEVESYRAVYIQAFDFGCSDAMNSTGVSFIEMAIEDAEMDKLTETNP
jgi:hypothetical protein